VDAHAWVALATLVAVVTLFITKWVAMEATALAIPVVLSATGALDPTAALSGFSNKAVIAIAAIFILSAGLQESGVARLLARLIERLGRGSEPRTIVMIMVTVCLLSAFMSSAATVAVFLPVVAVLGKRTGSAPSRLMMPLAYAAILGGTITLIGTTPNLILGEELRLRTGTGLAMFDFTRIGVVVSVAGIAYMALVGRRLLRRTTQEERLGDVRLPNEVAEQYGFRDNLYRMKVLPQSAIVGLTIEEADIRAKWDLDCVLVFRPAGLGSYFHPRPDLRLQAEDQLYLEGEAEAAWRFSEEALLQFGVAGPRSLDRILGRGLTLTEVTVPPLSGAFGKTFRELDFRKRYGLNVISVWRKGKAVTAGTADIELELGDAFLVSGTPEDVAALARDPDFVVLLGDHPTEDVRRAPLAVAIMLVALLPPILGWLPLAVSAIGAAICMVGFRCVSLVTARRSVDWRVLFVIIGTIPLGLALERHGVAGHAADAILRLAERFGEASVHLSLFALSALIAVTCNNGAAAIILAPVAAQAAAGAGVAPAQAFLGVAFGASCAFVLPFGNQCSLMVMGPGGYTARDYFRAGAGLTVLMAVTTVALLTIL